MSDDQDQRIAALEDEIRMLGKKLEELRFENDELRTLADDRKAQAEDTNALLEQWIDAFDMTQNDAGEWALNTPALVAEAEQYEIRYRDLRKDWNRFVPLYNASAAARPRNFGRPLAASEAQCRDVLRRRTDGQSIRTIAKDTGLSLRTIRTITEKADRIDRTTLGRLSRIVPDEVEKRKEAARQARFQLRKALPKRINDLTRRRKQLAKAAKGLGCDS